MISPKNDLGILTISVFGITYAHVCEKFACTFSRAALPADIRLASRITGNLLRLLISTGRGGGASLLAYTEMWVRKYNTAKTVHTYYSPAIYDFLAIRRSQWRLAHPAVLNSIKLLTLSRGCKYTYTSTHTYTNTHTHTNTQQLKRRHTTDTCSDSS